MAVVSLSLGAGGVLGAVVYKQSVTERRYARLLRVVSECLRDVGKEVDP